MKWMKWNTFLERLPIYLFPIFLIVLEWLVRAALSIDTQAFIGPTLAAVGAGYVIPLTVGKQREYPANIAKALRQSKLTARPVREIQFIALCWACIFVFTTLWAVSLYLAATKAQITWFGLPSYYYPGLLNYGGGFILSEVREAI